VKHKNISYRMQEQSAPGIRLVSMILTNCKPTSIWNCKYVDLQEVRPEFVIVVLLSNLNINKLANPTDLGCVTKSPVSLSSNHLLGFQFVSVSSKLTICNI
jgi:hypothetical protein